MALAEWAPCSRDTVDVVGTLNHGILLLFLRYGTRELAEGDASVGILKDLIINEDIRL